MSELAKATARKFIEEQDRLRGPADELCADDYIAYMASFPPMDLEGHKSFSAAFYAGFPDLKHNIEEVVAEGGSGRRQDQVHRHQHRKLHGQPCIREGHRVRCPRPDDG